MEVGLLPYGPAVHVGCQQQEELLGKTLTVCALPSCVRAHII